MGKQRDYAEGFFDAIRDPDNADRFELQRGKLDGILSFFIVAEGKIVALILDDKTMKNVEHAMECREVLEQAQAKRQAKQEIQEERPRRAKRRAEGWTP